MSNELKGCGAKPSWLHYRFNPVVCLK